MSEALLILGNQLFHPEIIQKQLSSTAKPLVYMREDEGLCTHFQYHKHKLVFFLAAMRVYAEELRAKGFRVHYEKLDKQSGPYEKSLSAFLKKHKVKKLFCFEIEDKFFEQIVEGVVEKCAVDLQTWESPMFLTSRRDFGFYLKQSGKPFMKTFYESQRKRLKILVDKKNKPVGDRWSFDEDNRKPVPKDYKPPAMPRVTPSAIEKTVIQLVNKEFKDHPGEANDFWLPTDRRRARAWLESFLKTRFQEFGPYEDALTDKTPFVSHSVLTPFLNTGLLTPGYVVQRALEMAPKYKVPLNSCEGFIRQVIGWREFIRGIYQSYSEQQETKNFWQHKRKLTPSWYDGTTGIEPLDDVIHKVVRYGYAHHIERLMVVGNLMLLLEIHPHEAHRWFMEMFIDSSDWVMGPNVYGMALFSDGGVFATKPYICGSNYYRKMGHYSKGGWQDAVDGLYWSFVEKNESFFKKNPRLSMMVKMAGKLDKERKKKIYQAAEDLRDRITRLT